MLSPKVWSVSKVYAGVVMVWMVMVGVGNWKVAWQTDGFIICRKRTARVPSTSQSGGARGTKVIIVRRYFVLRVGTRCRPHKGKRYRAARVWLRLGLESPLFSKPPAAPAARWAAGTWVHAHFSPT